jgi:tol-pal system protein YbgF
VRQHDQQIRDLRQRVAELQSDRAKGSKQIADQLNEVTVLQREISTLRGQMESNNQRMSREIDALRRQVEGTAPPGPPGPGAAVDPRPGPAPAPQGPPERAEDLYKAAMFRFEEGDNVRAREGFTAVVARFPDSPMADNAQFWVGECYFREGNFKQAILEYEKVISQYPKSDKIAPATLKQGMAFEKLGDAESARYLYSKVVKDFPKSEQARMAEHRLRSIP